MTPTSSAFSPRICRRETMNLPPCGVQLRPLQEARGHRLVTACTLISSGPSSIRYLSSYAPAASPAIVVPPRELPRLSPTSFPNLHPPSLTRADQSSPQRRAIALSQLLTLLNDANSDADEVFASYRRVLDLPGGDHLLSYQDVRRVISKLRYCSKERVGIATRTALERLNIIFDGVRREMSHSHGLAGPVERLEWDSLLQSRNLHHDLVRLISTVRNPQPAELQEMLDLLRSRFALNEPTESASQRTGSGRRNGVGRGLGPSPPRLISPDRITHNLVLNFLAKVARRPNLRNLQYEVKRDDRGNNITPTLVQQLPLQRLVTSSLPQGRAASSLEVMCQLLYSLWNDMVKSPKFAPDSFAWSSRLLLEGKVAAHTLFLALNEIPAGSSVAVVEHAFDHSNKSNSWIIIQDSLRMASNANVLDITHINQVIWQFAKMTAAVKQTTAESAPDVFPGVMKRFFGLDTSSGTSDAVSELYEALRWNQVRNKRDKLRRSKLSQKDGQADSVAGRNIGRGAKSSEPPSMNVSTADTVTRLLGIAIPRHIVPDDITYRILIRYYAITQGDYDKAYEILADYKQSGNDAVDDDQTGSSLNGGGGGGERLVTIGMLETFCKGFALFGAAAKEDDQGRWCMINPSEQNNPWRFENLLPLLDALLDLPSPRRIRLRGEQARYARLLSTVSSSEDQPRGKGKGNGNDSQVKKTLSQSSSSPSSSSNPQIRPPKSTEKMYDVSGISPAQYNHAPSPRQLFFIITALRRCTADSRPDLVLRYWNALLVKFGSQENVRRDMAEIMGKGPAGDHVLGRRGSGQEDEVVGEEEEAQPKGKEKVAASDQEEEEDSDLDENEEEEELINRTDNVNEQGWIGWRMDNRLKRLIPYLEEKARNLLAVSRRGEVKVEVKAEVEAKAKTEEGQQEVWPHRKWT